MATHNYTIEAYAGRRDCFGVHMKTIPQPTLISQKEMEKSRAKGLCFSYNNKWSKGHKC
jgi:hypothetical protein